MSLLTRRADRDNVAGRNKPRNASSTVVVVAVLMAGVTNLSVRTGATAGNGSIPSPITAPTAEPCVAPAVACTSGAVSYTSSGHNQQIDDTCNKGGPNSSQFYADGPPQYWFDASYSGGPDPCMMYTYNEYQYKGPTVGNEGYWYNCIGTCSGGYYLYAYIPPIHAYTTNAIYQIWNCGHSCGVLTALCYVNQAPYNNYWYQLCPRNGWFYMYGTTTYGGFILLQDGTGEASGTKQIGYDNGYYGYVSGT